MSPTKLLMILVAWSLAACGSDGVSTAEAREAAEQRVRERFNLPAGTALDTEIFVGRPRDGETVLCGTVAAAEGAGNPFPPQRFLASTDPARWLVFEPAHSPIEPSQPDMFAEWGTHCLGEESG